MLLAYLNYPNPKIRVHGQSTCGEIGKMKKAGQRNVAINTGSISSELQNFATKRHRFGADATLNDMWLTVDFDDPTFEEAVVQHLQKLIGRHYDPFAAVRIDRHC